MTRRSRASSIALALALSTLAVDATPFFVVHAALTAWADLGLDRAATSLVPREDTVAKDPARGVTT